MKAKQKMKVLFATITLTICIFLGIVPDEAYAATTDEYITISVEKFSLGQGYIVEPIKVPFKEGDNGAKLVTEILGEGKYRNTGSIDSSFYLSGVLDPGSKGIIDTVPQYILDMVDIPLGSNTDDWLNEFDFTFYSGWKYAVNDEFLGYGLSDYDPVDGDVVRFQFTVWGFGADLDVDANKDALIQKVAEINSVPNKAELLTHPNISEAYNNAYKVLENLESTSAKVNEALVELLTALDKPSDIQAPVIQLGEVEKVQTITYGADYTVPVLTATDNVDESVIVTSTITNVDGKVIDAIDTTISGTYTITYSAMDAAGNQANEIVLTLEVKELLKVTPSYSLNDQINNTLSFILESVSNPTFDTGGGEWSIISLARGGHLVPENYYNIYYENVIEAVKRLMPENGRKPEGRLDTNKGSEHSRLILGLTAIGKDVTDVGGYNILEALADFSYMTKQGVNGPIFALIALDSNSYEIPQIEEISNQATKQKYINYILEKEIAGGGWALGGNNPDPDVTAMAIQSLTPYLHQDEVKTAVNRGVAWLSNVQEKDGSYASWGTNNSESTSQVIVALTSLSIDPHTDTRFVKNGNSVIDALMSFAGPNGGFMHVKPGSGSLGVVDGMATDQAAYALVAYQRLINGQKRLYDMTDVVIETESPVKEDPVDEEPVDEEPVEEVPVDEEPVEEVPVDEEPVEEVPVDEDPVDEEPVKEDPVKKDPVEEEPVKVDPVKEADETLPKMGDASSTSILILGMTLIAGGMILAKKPRHHS